MGAGRLGTALALALEKRGYDIVALVSRRGSSARRAARLFTRSRPAHLSSARLDRLPPSDLLIIATPDDQIERTTAQLADALAAKSLSGGTPGASKRRAPLTARRRRPVALHASGALSSAALSPLHGAGLAVGSLHPLVSVAEPQSGAQVFAGAFFCVEGDTEAVRAARRIVRALRGHSFSVAARDKALYHAAAVLSAGHAVALFDLACGLLGRCGLKRGRARDVLLPLARSALDNLASATTPARSLTGPFARGDSETVAHHLAALRGDELKIAHGVYELLGAHSLRLARERGADEEALAGLARVLAAGARGA